jgi:rSAM/selenodomain-associated transferase 2
MLSIVIPTLNAAEPLRATLRHLAEEAAGAEIVVVDGGSGDDSCVIAAAAGARTIVAPRGRGSQLRAGVAAAGGDWLLCLHADTRPAPGWRGVVEAFAHGAGPDRAAAFRLRLDDGDPRARRIERWAAWRCRRFGLAFGDQGLLIARRFYEALGGYRPLPLMEDVDLVRRIGRRRLVLLDHPAITSAARYRQGGWTRRPARNLAVLAMYFLGVSPALLARLYGR